MLQYINGKLCETTAGQTAVEMWVQHQQDPTTTNKIDLQEYLLTRRYAAQEQCVRIDRLLGKQLQAGSVRGKSATNFGAWRYLTQQKKWLADFAFCAQVPLTLRRIARASLPLDYKH